MDIQTILAPVAAMLPAAWGDDVRLTVAGGIAVAVLMMAVMGVAAALGWRRDADGVDEDAAPAALPGASTLRAAVPGGAAPDLDPEEWVSGSIVHFDRQRAVGLIRCDRVKGHVRFEAADFKRAPRVGEAVRFKGRHGARRRPVADVVERLPGAKRAG